ncbi:MAG: cbb3-type cytochrome oxidase assembly protein CcoS [Phycisphaerae bacterium]
MSVIFIVLPLAFVFALLALLGFIWATNTGQFDDLDTTAIRPLLDDEPAGRGKKD